MAIIILYLFENKHYYLVFGSKKLNYNDKIKIPDNNVSERKYVIDVLFSFLKDFQYVIEIDVNQNDYVISYEEKNIIVKDDFSIDLKIH